MPVYQYVEETASYRNIRKRFDELAQSVGVLVYHVLDDFQQYPAGKRRQLRFRMDCHYTPIAHDLMGRALAKVVAPLLQAGGRTEHSPMPGAASGIDDERQMPRPGDPGKQETGGERALPSQGVAT